jgi:CRP-like cAMP-binding protein
MNAKDFQAGSYVFHKGDQGDEFFLVLDGLLEVYVPVGPEFVSDVVVRMLDTISDLDFDQP